jgi:hypothetical protein
MDILIFVGAVLFLLAVLGYLGFLAWLSHRGTRKNPTPLLGVYTPEDYDAPDR